MKYVILGAVLGVILLRVFGGWFAQFFLGEGEE